METITLAAAAALIGIVATISGVVLGWLGQRRANRTDLISKTTADVQMRTDVEYIKRGVDDIRTEAKVQNQRLDMLCDRVARVEESAKSAHKRLDEHIGGKEK